MRRIVFSIASFRTKLPAQPTLTSTKSRWKFYTEVGHRSFHTAWVKRRNTRGEQMFSAVHPTTDIAKILRHVRLVPLAEVHPLLDHLVGRGQAALAAPRA